MIKMISIKLNLNNIKDKVIFKFLDQQANKQRRIKSILLDYILEDGNDEDKINSR